MTGHTKLSAKGQVVIPKDLRDRLGLRVGEDFEVFDRGEEVVLRRTNGRRSAQARESVEQAVREIQAIYRYDGPPVTEEMIQQGIESAIRKKFGPKPKQ